MVSQTKSLRLIAVVAPTAIVALTATLLLRLPSEIRLGLTIWILLSVPFGALIGHCVLSEEHARIRRFPSSRAACNEPDAGRFAGRPHKADG